ncbi:hypothetical protein QE410_003181 [Microbacterium sp. SORGH_AS 1204]|uniref:hypothetical protein n=1 Tax=Microbacterium sp. SORGH_AS_1204 TaxID=3041785 RepID=UPI002794E197|nr:hypothetical protein [Microbacterium sp. SORGH_AS_1204]MDQ1138382.1 hypothetical protein [Microbacterium sp. SORGH_AS_1204]
MRLSSRFVSGIVCTGLVLVTVGCTGSTENPFDALCADPVVVTCEPADGPLSITVDAAAADDAVQDFAGRVQDAATQTQRELTLRADDPSAVQLDPEVTATPKWQFTLQPGGTVDALAGVLEAAAVPGASGIFAGLGWPSAEAATLDDVEPLITALSSTTLFADGGTFTVPSLRERFRLVYVPAFTTLDGVREVVSVARDYPDAEVLLEAPTAGPNQPTFYVAHLTPDEAVQLEARLSAPQMASASIAGAPLEFVLTSLTEQGTESITGTFGGIAG